MPFILWIFILGYLCQHLGTLLQIKKIEKTRSISGVSFDTQILFLVGAIARAIWVTDTMLKEYWLTYAELAIALVSLIYTIYLCLFKYNQYEDTKPIPIFFRWYPLLVASAILSYFYFPGDEGQKFDVQMLVSLTMFSEAAGLLPQIVTVNRQKDSSNFSSFYLFFLTVSRILRLIFWIKMYLDDAGFMFLILADVIHVLLVLGFIVSFVKNLNYFSLDIKPIRVEMTTEKHKDY
jgi:ER lumen protein retaining receptor